VRFMREAVRLLFFLQISRAIIHILEQTEQKWYKRKRKEIHSFQLQTHKRKEDRSFII